MSTMALASGLADAVMSFVATSMTYDVRMSDASWQGYKHSSSGGVSGISGEGGGGGGGNLIDNASSYYDWTGYDDVDSNMTSLSNDSSLTLPWEPTPLVIAKAVTIALVMLVAAFGNLLVIVSIVRTPRLRIIANSFLVSLAFADFLVAVLVMPFNASKELAGKSPLHHTYNCLSICQSCLPLQHNLISIICSV